MFFRDEASVCREIRDIGFQRIRRQDTTTPTMPPPARVCAHTHTRAHTVGAKVLWQEGIWRPSEEVRGSTRWGKQAGTSRVMMSEQSKMPRAEERSLDLSSKHMKHLFQSVTWAVTSQSSLERMAWL